MLDRPRPPRESRHECAPDQRGIRAPYVRDLQASSPAPPVGYRSLTSPRIGSLSGCKRLASAVALPVPLADVYYNRYGYSRCGN
jgi:hypothetical protein